MDCLPIPFVCFQCGTGMLMCQFTATSYLIVTRPKPLPLQSRCSQLRQISVAQSATLYPSSVLFLNMAFSCG
ncbi:hypothetical protein E4T50_06552 [Aureobasidium sp. EXF-12298]|nr:hypothetical protein E4T50_06552 [Aureobasidium sp. EXF-12298]KAI4758921.1 hypothetical protein E4T51_08048 [Aureobasidium sp. EXF-12344]